MQTRFPNRYLPYLLISPMIIVVLVFFFSPSVESLYLSFFRVSPLGNRKIFIGLENFTELLTSSDYLNSLWLTVQFALFIVLVGLSFSLFVAVVANQKLRGFSVQQIAH